MHVLHIHMRRLGVSSSEGRMSQHFDPLLLMKAANDYERVLSATQKPASESVVTCL